MKLIVGNWKMNPKNSLEAENLFQEIKKEVGSVKNKEIVICPPFIYLSNLQSISTEQVDSLQLGAQNCFWEEKGAFTGEISPVQLKNLGVKYVILGHSERRQYLRETDEMIAKKLKAVLEARLLPILCIGETKEEREAEKTADVLRFQLENSLQNLSLDIHHLTSLIIAYEPVWAIGSGDFCPPDEALSNFLFIKKQLIKIFSSFAKSQRINPAEKIRILYGGSVDSKNAKDYIDIGFDGLLIGGASLRAGEFIKIVKICAM